MIVKLCDGSKVNVKEYLQQFLNSGANTVLHPRQDYNKQQLFDFATERSEKITDLHRVLTGFLLAVAEAVDQSIQRRDPNTTTANDRLFTESWFKNSPTEEKARPNK